MIWPKKYRNLAQNLSEGNQSQSIWIISLRLSPFVFTCGAILILMHSEIFWISHRHVCKSFFYLDFFLEQDLKHFLDSTGKSLLQWIWVTVSTIDTFIIFSLIPLKKAFDRYKLELIVEEKISFFTCGAILHFSIHKPFPALVVPFLKYSKLIGE